MSVQPGNQPGREQVAAILDRIVADPAFRQNLLDDPATAMSAVSSGQTEDEAEVTGYLMCRRTCMVTCSHSCGGVSCDITS